MKIAKFNVAASLLAIAVMLFSADLSAQNLTFKVGGDDKEKKEVVKEKIVEKEVEKSGPSVSQELKKMFGYKDETSLTGPRVENIGKFFLDKYTGEVTVFAYYKNEPVILGYDLLNEPIAPYFENQAELDAKLAAVYKMGVDAIREVDKNHIILLGGAQWNGNFKPLENTLFDDKIMYTCHRYGGGTDANAIRSFIEFRDRTNRPMYMGEIGHNTDEWMASFCKTMVDNNIGYTFWPYKKIHNSSFVGIKAPEGWRKVIAFSEAPRGTYNEVRKARPNQEEARKALMQFVENSRFENCNIQKGYIRAIQLKAD